MSEILQAILEVTHVMFGLIKEVILELMEERLGEFHAELVVGQFRARTLTFREFCACVAPEFFVRKNPLPRWVKC